MYSLLEKAVAVFALVASVKAQSAQQLQGAIESYPELSTFSDFLKAVPKALDNVFSNEKITVLIPDNDAIAEYLKTTKTADLSKVDPGALRNFLEYHVMATALKGSDFTGETGMVVPTELKDEKFNNRTAGVAIQQRYGDNATGQVIFAAREEKSTQSTGSAPTVDLRGGLAQDSKMKAVDGTWGASNSSYFQIVDKVLVPPRNCSTTVRNAGDDRLEGLDKALINAKLWPALDTSKNVTCLAPSTQAFKDAGNPEDTLSQLELSQALLAHTLNEVTYTNYLEDGQSIGTLNGTSVTVKIDGDDIYFNNAKVIEANVLTNNGLIHILDALIQPDGTPTSSGNNTSTGSPSSASNTGSPTPTNAGSLLSVNVLGLVAVVISLVV